ncbi:hypothetical protein GCM10027521_50600 [Amycolatopsis cihanbeyliensis]
MVRAVSRYRLTFGPEPPIGDGREHSRVVPEVDRRRPDHGDHRAPAEEHFLIRLPFANNEEPLTRIGDMPALNRDPFITRYPAERVPVPVGHGLDPAAIRMGEPLWQML